MEKPAKTIVKKEVVEKVVYKDRTKVVYKNSLFENILKWPLKIEASYLNFFALPVLDNRIIFKTQSANETVYWVDLGPKEVIVPGFRIRAKQYISKNSFLGIKFSQLNSTQDSAITQFDTRVDNSIATTITNTESLLYGMEYGSKIFGTKIYTIEYSGGLSVFSATRSFSTSYISGSTTGSQAKINDNISIYYIDTEILSKFHYGDFAGLFGLNLGFPIFDSGDGARIEAFDPNISPEDESESSKAQLEKLYSEKKNSATYSISIGISYTL